MVFFLCSAKCRIRQRRRPIAGVDGRPRYDTIIIYRMVGLHGEGADRFAGRINITGEEQRFWVKIAAPDFDSFALQFCKTHPVAPNAKVSMIVWWNCAADSEVTFSENRSIPSMRGNAKTYPGQIQAAERRQLFQDIPRSEYILFDSYESGKRFYLEEGACEGFEVVASLCSHDVHEGRGDDAPYKQNAGDPDSRSDTLEDELLGPIANP